jgi:GNAT superfamily N-acetyltransferase
MNLVFERVLQNEDDKIEKVYEIIKDSGEDMLIKHGLTHWRTPYPFESIKKDCLNREVFLIKDLDMDQYVHTFQLGFNENSPDITSCQGIIESIAYIYKFATSPQFTGSGIGKRSMEYIESYCRSKGVSKLCLDVYIKSEHAIRFYLNKGFKITGEQPTRHFAVYLMEKQL